VTPQQLLARYRDAAGRCLTPGVYYFKFRTTTSYRDAIVTDDYESRGAGKLEDFLIVTTTHGLRSEQGRVSDRSWMQTANGLVLPDSQRQTPFDRVLSAAVHKPDPRVRMLGITTAPKRQYVLEIAPNARLLQRRYFDVGTFLLREMRTRDYDKVVGVDRFSRHIYVCGKPVPTRVDHSDSLSSETYQTTLVRHQLLADPHLLAIPQSRTPFVPQYRLPATLNSMFGPFGILIRVDIQGDPYWFKLDSGASTVTLDRDLVQRLGGHEFARYSGTKGGAVDYAAAVVPRLDIGPVYATNLTVGVINHDYVEQGVHVVGLLGCDFIASWPLSVDFRRQTVVLGTAPPETDRRWTSVRTRSESCRPTIHARLENQPATLVLDLGATETVINEDLYDRIAASVHEVDTTLVRFIGGDALAATQYVVPNASAGALSLGPIVASVVAEGRGQDLDNDGFLGLNVLRNYRIVMDYRHQQTYFQKYGPTQ
jgi:predicted aspartyl protease